MRKLPEKLPQLRGWFVVCGKRVGSRDSRVSFHRGARLGESSKSDGSVVALLTRDNTLFPDVRAPAQGANDGGACAAFFTGVLARVKFTVCAERSAAQSIHQLLIACPSTPTCCTYNLSGAPGERMRTV